MPYLVSLWNISISMGVMVGGCANSLVNRSSCWKLKTSGENHIVFNLEGGPDHCFRGDTLLAVPDFMIFVMSLRVMVLNSGKNRLVAIMGSDFIVVECEAV